MIDELRALIAGREGPRVSGRSRETLRAALDRQGLAGSVWIVAGDTFNAERLRKLFVELAKERGLKGVIRAGGRQVEIGETSFHFITLGEDGSLPANSTSPRYIDEGALVWSIANLIRDTAGRQP